MGRLPKLCDSHRPVHAQNKCKICQQIGNVRQLLNLAHFYGSPEKGQSGQTNDLLWHGCVALHPIGFLHTPFPFANLPASSGCRCRTLYNKNAWFVLFIWSELFYLILRLSGTNKLDFLHLRITSLSSLNRRIWIGTGSGIIISVPLKDGLFTTVAYRT